MANMTTQEILQGIKDWAAPKVIYDISTAHNNTKYTDLADALGTNGDNIPQEYKKGGITVRFVRTYDNKYVQYRLMADEFSTNQSDWALCSEDVLVENPEYIRVYTDKEGKILWAIKTDGSIYWGVGVPQQVIDYVTSKISEYHLNNVSDISNFIGNLTEGDNLATLLEGKVDTEEGKSLIDSDYAERVNYANVPDFIQAIVDADGKIVEGIKTDGQHYFPILPDSIKQYTNDCIDSYFNSSLEKVNAEFVNGDLDTNFQTIEDNNTIHTVINTDPRYIYLVTMPDTMVGGFVGKTISDSEIVKRLNTSGFSLYGSENQLGVIFKNEYTKAKETPTQVNLGEFELGGFYGGGGDIESTKSMRTAWINVSGRMRITHSSSVVVQVNIYQAYHRWNRVIENGTIFTVDDKFRLALWYVNGDDADENLIAAANLSVELINETEYNLSTESITNSDASKVGIYRLLPKNNPNEVVIGGSTHKGNMRNIDFCVDGENDGLFLQSLVGCYNSLTISLVQNSQYNLNQFHYNRYSNQYSCLSTFVNTGVYRTTTLKGIDNDALYGTPYLKVNDSILNKIEDNNENSIFLSPKDRTVEEALYESYILNKVIIRDLSINGNLYNKDVVAIDLTSPSGAIIENVTVKGWLVDGRPGFPTMPNEESVGIRMGHGSCFGVSTYIKHCYVIHFGKGISILGEHYVIEDCAVQECKYGYAFGDKPTKVGFEHPNILLGCSIESCYRLMLLTKQGDMEEKPFTTNSSENKIRSTLVVIGLSTEMSWKIPIDELIEGGPTRQRTLPILEILKGAYRGRVELDWTDNPPSNVPFETGSGEHFTFTTYNTTTNIGVFNTVEHTY